MEDNNNNAIVVQRDATTCAPLGEPKSLISKGGKNVLDYNQEPPLEFVSDKNRLDCFAFHARIKRIRLRLTSSARVAQNDATTCPPLEGGPKSLISRRGKNAMNSNQEPSPELGNGETCQGLLRRFVHKITNNNEISPHNDMIIKTVKNLFPYFTISLPLKKKIAFTLAETLITLGIIGIVAALTIPTLFANYQKRMTITRLKASYSKLTQALQAATDDYGPVEQWFLNDNDVSHYETIITAVIHEKIIPYAKVIDDCGLNCPLRKKVKICRLNGVCTWGQRDSGYYTIYLADGSSWEFMIDNNGRTMMNIKVYIDINGNGKPNIFGKDIFVVLLDDGVRLLGSDAKYSRSSLLGNCRECCSKNAGSYAGDRCGGLIQRDGWQIMPDYPWK